MSHMSDSGSDTSDDHDPVVTVRYDRITQATVSLPRKYELVYVNEGEVAEFQKFAPARPGGSTQTSYKMASYIWRLPPPPTAADDTRSLRIGSRGPGNAKTEIEALCAIQDALETDASGRGLFPTFYGWTVSPRDPHAALYQPVFYVVQDNIEGYDLDRYSVKEQTYMTGVGVAMMVDSDILGPFVRAVDFLHRHDIVHNDLKPANVMYDMVNKRLYLIDFDQACCDIYTSSDMCQSSRLERCAEVSGDPDFWPYDDRDNANPLYRGGEVQTYRDPIDTTKAAVDAARAAKAPNAVRMVAIDAWCVATTLLYMITGAVIKYRKPASADTYQAALREACHTGGVDRLATAIESLLVRDDAARIAAWNDLVRSVKATS